MKVPFNFPAQNLACILEACPGRSTCASQESSTKVSVSEEPRGRAPQNRTGPAQHRQNLSLRAEESSKAEEEVDNGKEDWPAGVRHVPADEGEEDENWHKIGEED